MFISLAQRRREAEWMDAPDADPALLDISLRYIRRVNTLLGYTRQTLSHFKRFSRGWSSNQTIRVLDIGTGSADVPIALLTWAERAGFDVRVTGIDLHEKTIASAVRAREALPESLRDRLTLQRGDALNLPFAAGEFDYAMCSLFLHHLDNDQIVRSLQEMDRVTTRGIVACDLLRHYRAYAWITLFSLTANAMVRHDARVSVAQSLRKDEALQLRDQAGLGYLSYHRHFAHRFALAGEK